MAYTRRNNIRRFHGVVLERDSVLETLTAAGLRVTVTTHKAGTSQSHGRWAVRGDAFEVHLAYKGNGAPPAPLADTVVQGLKGWKAHADLLDRVAELLQQAHYSPSHAPPSRR